MIKQVQSPGDALMQIDFDTEPEHIHVPLITRADIQSVAQDVTVCPKSEIVAPASSCEASVGLIPTPGKVTELLQQERENSSLGKMAWNTQLSEATGISTSVLNSVLTGHRELSTENTKHCWTFLNSHSTIR